MWVSPSRLQSAERSRHGRAVTAGRSHERCTRFGRLAASRGAEKSFYQTPYLKQKQPSHGAATRKLHVWPNMTQHKPRIKYCATRATRNRRPKAKALQGSLCASKKAWNSMDTEKGLVILRLWLRRAHDAAGLA